MGWLTCGLWAAGLAAAPTVPPARADAGVPFAVVIQGVDAFSRRLAVELSEFLGAELDALPGWRLTSLEPSPDGDGWARARERLADGIEAFWALEPARASAELGAALEGMRAAGAALERVDRADYLRALLYLAGAAIMAEDPQRGQELFRQALAFEPAASLPEADFSPGMQHLFEAARAELAAHPTGALAVFSVPDLARVHVDGVFRGVTPCELAGLVPGPHWVCLRRRGYSGVCQMVTLTGAARAELSLRLAAGPDPDGLEEAVRQAVAAMPREAASALVARAAPLGIERILVGRLSHGGAGHRLQAAWLAVPEGGFGPVRSLGLAEDRRVWRQVVEGFSVGAWPVLECPGPGAETPERLALQDEERFRAEEEPAWWTRWWFWTAVGATLLVAGAVTLGVLLSADQRPGSQIVLEF